MAEKPLIIKQPALSEQGIKSIPVGIRPLLNWQGMGHYPASRSVLTTLAKACVALIVSRPE